MATKTTKAAANYDAVEQLNHGPLGSEYELAADVIGDVSNAVVDPPAEATEEPKKKPAKKDAKPAKAKAKTSNGPSVRQWVFELLAASPSGVTGPAVRDQLELAGIPSCLKDEGVCDKPRIRRSVVEGTRGVVYSLTALGKKDLKAGKVDINKAPSGANKPWPEGR